MPPFVMSILLKYVAPALGVILLLWGAYHWAEKRGEAKMVAKYQPVMNRAQNRIALAVTALKDADATINLLSESNKAFTLKMNQAQAAAHAARVQADKRDVSRQAQIAILKDSASHPIEGAPCASLDAVKDAWK